MYQILWWVGAQQNLYFLKILPVLKLSRDSYLEQLLKRVFYFNNMSKIITACELVYQEKVGIYTMTTRHKEGQWEGAQSGAKIYRVGDYLVQTSWGAGKPIAVFKDEDEMLLHLEQIYNVKPSLEYK